MPKKNYNINNKNTIKELSKKKKNSYKKKRKYIKLSQLKLDLEIEKAINLELYLFLKSQQILLMIRMI